jgi:hypothetical protein
MAPKRLLLMLVALAIAVGFVYVITRILNPTGDSGTPPITLQMSNLFTARNVIVDNEQITSADVTSKFEATDDPIWACYDVVVSEPVTMTYRWYHESEFIFKHTARIESGTWCTAMTFSEPKILPAGKYHIDFILEGNVPAGSIEFSVISKTG